MPFTALGCLIQGTSADEPTFCRSHDGYICIRIWCEEHTVGSIQIDFFRISHIEHYMFRHVNFIALISVDFNTVFLHSDINGTRSLVVEYNNLIRILVDMQFTGVLSDFVS